MKTEIKKTMKLIKTRLLKSDLINKDCGFIMFFIDCRIDNLISNGEKVDNALIGFILYDVIVRLYPLYLREISDVMSDLLGYEFFATCSIMCDPDNQELSEFVMSSKIEYEQKIIRDIEKANRTLNNGWNHFVMFTLLFVPIAQIFSVVYFISVGISHILNITQR